MRRGLPFDVVVLKASAKTFSIPCVHICTFSRNKTHGSRVTYPVALIGVALIGEKHRDRQAIFRASGSDAAQVRPVHRKSRALGRLDRKGGGFDGAGGRGRRGGPEPHPSGCRTRSRRPCASLRRNSATVAGRWRHGARSSHVAHDPLLCIAAPIP